MAELTVGARMWLKCEVNPGPFSDERMVLVKGESGDWFGFVNVRWLRNENERGKNEVSAKIVEVDGLTFRAGIPGNAFRRGLLEGRIADRVEGVASG